MVGRKVRANKLMMKKENNIVDIDQLMNEQFGEVGSKEREDFRKEAYNYCVGQLILEARNNAF